MASVDLTYPVNSALTVNSSGAITTTGALTVNGNFTATGNAAAAEYYVGGTTQIRAGTVTPNGALGGTAGDLYIWTNGASGSRLWVSGGGTVWTAVAGV